MLRSEDEALRAVKAELQAAYDGALYFPFAFSEKRPLRTTQGYLVKFPAAILDLFPNLAVARKPAPRRGASGTGRSGRQQDPAVRKAIERHAVDWTLHHFDSIGFAVDDVGLTESFDVLALGPNDEELHIEVKGSSGEASTVELTDGEVQHWGDDFERVLVVVDSIKWTKEGVHVRTSGGAVRVWRDWTLDGEEESLLPIRFRYTLPGYADEH